MTESISFFVPGIPAPGGSKRGIYNAKLGRTLIFENNPEKNRNWRASVALAASEAMKGREPFNGPIALYVTFVMPRPKSHFNSKGVLKDSAPDMHTKKPDLLKITRSTEDAMTGIVWKDDALIFWEQMRKYYGHALADFPGHCGAKIEVSEILE